VEEHVKTNAVQVRFNAMEITKKAAVILILMDAWNMEEILIVRVVAHMDNALIVVSKNMFAAWKTCGAWDNGCSHQ